MAKYPLFPDEIIFIKENFDTMTYDELLTHLNKSRGSSNKISYPTLRHRFKDLDLHRYKLIHWKIKEAAYLVKNYRTKGNVEIATDLNDNFNSKRIFKKGHIIKKMELMNLSRTDYEISAIHQRNIELGIAIVNQPGETFKEIWNEGEIRQWMHGTHMFNFIKINGENLFNGVHIYEQRYGKMKDSYVLYRKDMDRLNDDIDNLDSIKRRKYVKSDYSDAIRLIKKRILAIHNNKKGRPTNSEKDKGRSARYTEIRRLEKHNRILTRKMNKL